MFILFRKISLATSEMFWKKFKYVLEQLQISSGSYKRSFEKLIKLASNLRNLEIFPDRSKKFFEVFRNLENFLDNGIGVGMSGAAGARPLQNATGSLQDISVFYIRNG